MIVLLDLEEGGRCSMGGGYLELSDFDSPCLYRWIAYDIENGMLQELSIAKCNYLLWPDVAALAKDCRDIRHFGDI